MEEVEGKVQKHDVLYIFRPETQYTCDMCLFGRDGSNKPGTKCKVFGETEDIKPYGSCGYFIHSGPDDKAPEMPYIGLITKEQAGYEENKEGFSCKRCEYFDPTKNDCHKVNKDSDGDTPGMIHPNACCNGWEADDTRSKINMKKLAYKMANKK